MKRVWSGATLPDTTHFMNLLEQAGIGCIIKNRHLGGALGDLPLFECSPELWVLEDAHERRASALLREAVAPARRDPFAQPGSRQHAAQVGVEEVGVVPGHPQADQPRNQRDGFTDEAAHRARQIANGATPLVEPGRDKPTVIALREMAIGKVGVEVLSRGQS